MSIVVNSRGFQSGLDRSVKRFEDRFRKRVQKLLSEGLRRMIRRTPVHTGQAVMNYVASGGVSRQPLRPGFDPVEPTNRLPLGSEALRPAAEARALATLRTVDFSDPFKNFYITNRTPHIGGLEHGELPTEPFVPRSPAGMFGVTLQELVQLLSTGRI